MATDFRALDREAHQRGVRDYHRGTPRDQNPFQGSATDERSMWFEAWDNEKEMGEPDANT